MDGERRLDPFVAARELAQQGAGVVDQHVDRSLTQCLHQLTRLTELGEVAAVCLDGSGRRRDDLVTGGLEFRFTSSDEREVRAEAREALGRRESETRGRAGDHDESPPGELGVAPVLETRTHLVTQGRETPDDRGFECGVDQSGESPGRVAHARNSEARIAPACFPKWLIERRNSGSSSARTPLPERRAS